MHEPDLAPTWRLDVEHLLATDAHEETEEHNCEPHRGKNTVDCGSTGMYPDQDILRSLVGDASPLGAEGSDSDQPTEPSNEPAPPCHPATMGGAGPMRGLGVAAAFAAAEGVDLMSGNL